MSQPRRFIFATDLHGDRQNEAAVKVLHEVPKDFKPHVRIVRGDGAVAHLPHYRVLK
jgi:hypothetical protein